MALDTFCSEDSVRLGEPLYGTASPYDLYIMVEWNHTYGAKADADFISREFEGEAGERWRQLWESLPNPRLQLIKQDAPSPDGIAVFVALPHEVNPMLYELRLENYHQIFDLDFPGLLTGELDYRHSLREIPLYLVCTNAKRDACCARLGLPLYTAMRAAAPESVWQCSHIGGHRFAGTLLCMPHGLCYGRLASFHAEQVIESYNAGELLPDFYRGRACYSAVQQVGEYFLRQQTGATTLDAFRLIETQSHAQAHTLVFESLLEDGGSVGGLSPTPTATCYKVHLTQHMSNWERKASCNDEKTEAVPLYTLAGFEATVE